MEQQLKHKTWFESPSARLKRWKEFRQGLDTKSTFEMCKTVIFWWESAPIVNITIDPVDSTQWPTPWEMLHQGDFCENSLALGMSYTIYYANQTIPNELIYVTCNGRSFQKLCSLIDNKHLLNYERGTISNFHDSECSISYRISVNDIIKKQ